MVGILIFFIFRYDRVHLLNKGKGLLNYVYKLDNGLYKYKYGVLNYILNSDADYNLDFICLLDGIATNNIINNFEKRGIEVIIYGTIKVNKNVKYIVDDAKMTK